jgi:hypothetical protein
MLPICGPARKASRVVDITIDAEACLAERYGNAEFRQRDISPEAPPFDQAGQ